VTYETAPWHFDPDALEGVSKSARRKIGSTYQAAVPSFIAEQEVTLPPEVETRIQEVLVLLGRFDGEQRAKGYQLPNLLLRSESSASSQIESLTSSARNVALAELSDSAPANARLVAGNIAAMNRALDLPDGITVEGILSIHEALINRSGQTFGGQLRDEQVWVGGTPYSPHGATFVPPVAERVPSLLEDLVAFASRRDVGPVAKAAIIHAQLETIHPFIDGNGRTGRTLIHKVLRDEGALTYATLPVSAGLLHNIDAYLDSIAGYQQGDIAGVVSQLADALELSCQVGYRASRELDATMEEWESTMTERRGSRIRELPALLVRQPVVDVAFVARELSISPRAASSLVNKACEYGMIRPMGNRRRGEFYQSDAILAVLDQISDVQGIKRMLSSS
jgi:Fic family protein